jgi:hypothetical protein
MGTNNALSNRYTDVYNKNLALAQEGRGAATGQQQYYGGQTNQASANALNAWKTSHGGVLGSEEGQAKYDIGVKSAPSWFSKNLAPIFKTTQAGGNAAMG